MRFLLKLVSKIIANSKNKLLDIKEIPVSLIANIKTTEQTPMHQIRLKITRLKNKPTLNKNDSVNI